MATLWAGCAEWPRASHLPRAGDILPPGVDPGRLFDVAYGALDATEPDDRPGLPGAAVTSLGLGEGVVVTGELAGIGFNQDAQDAGVSVDGCGTGAGRSPVAGDYTGDVDHVVVTVDAGTLCAQVDLSAATDVAFDALLVPLDACGLPGAPVEARGSMLGLDAVGGSTSWHHFTAGGSFAVQVAGWNPGDEARFVGWTLDLSLVESKPGDDALCPTVQGGE